MDKQDLMKSAGKIEPPSDEAADEFSSKKEEIALKQKKKMKERDDLEELIGDGNLSMLEDNLENMVDFFDSIFINYDPKVLVDNVHWVFRTYRSHGFRPEFWLVNLNTFVDIIDEYLSEESFKELDKVLQWMIDHVDEFIELTEGYQKGEVR